MTAGSQRDGSVRVEAGRTLGETATEGGVPALSRPERISVALLHGDGWSVAELEMTFQVGEGAIRKCINEFPAEPTAVVGGVDD